MKSQLKNILFAVLLLSGTGACKKYLDKKAAKDLVVPSTLQDAQALLDYKSLNAGYPALSSEGDDEYYLLQKDYDRLDAKARLRYTWEKDALVNDWDWEPLYQNVLCANMALETVGKVSQTEANENEWQRIKGSALFYRAYNFYWIATYWAKPYSPTTASSPGIPLRLTIDVNEHLDRGTVEATYQRILLDLKTALPLLPDTIIPVTRPSKAAVYGTLARVYMSMRDYEQAGKYADSCLGLKANLLDYNSMNAGATTPFKNFNPEVIFHSETAEGTMVYNNYAKIDSNLYGSYDSNDIRKTIFFLRNADGSHGFKGSYAGSNYNDVPFSGIATDEMYLLRAECAARKGDKAAALADLNTLLPNRWKFGTFTPLTAATADEALQLVLAERRKELIRRGLRWGDLLRLNQETSLQKTLARLVNGTKYELPPNDTRYVFMIPQETMVLHDWPQNVR
jgi:hypothetical protein